MTHSGMWNAIDKLAEKLGLSCSGLAKECNLDPTTFNKSKRWSRDGKPRWLSMNTVAKVIEVAGERMEMADVIEVLFNSEDDTQEE